MSDSLRIFTEAALADLFAIEERQAAKLRRRNGWPHFRVGREVRYTQAHVDQIIAASVPRPASEGESGGVLEIEGLRRTPRSAGRRRSA